MTNRDKLIKAMNRADLSGFHQLHALHLYDRHGLQDAMRYVNKSVMIDKIVKSELKYLGVVE